jgi:hypothetical protein
MRRRRPIITATVLVFTVVVLAIAMNNARADCVDGVRNVTPAELDFAQRAHAALVAGLPEAVRPIERRSPNRPDPGGSVNMSPCRGTPAGAFSPSASDGFLFQFTPEEATARSDQRQQLRRQIEDIERLPPDREAQRKEIEAQMRAAYAAAPTRSRKDPPFTPEQQAQVDRAQAEGRALEQAMRKIESDHRASVKPQTDPLRARMDDLQQGPQTFSVTVGMNLVRFPEAGPTTQVITFGAPTPRQSASLTAQNISVRIEGPAGPARDALAGLVDRAYLQALLGKPLPTVDASRARIAAVIAQAAGAPALAIAASMPTAASAVPAVAASPATAAAPIVPPAAAPTAAASAAPAAASTATPPATTAAARSPSASPCPPPARSAQNSTDAARSGGQAGAAVGSEVGGAVLGGGWGRSVGSAVGGALGALGGAAKKQEPPADCPR